VHSISTLCIAESLWFVSIFLTYLLHCDVGVTILKYLKHADLGTYPLTAYHQLDLGSLIGTI